MEKERAQRCSWALAMGPEGVREKSGRCSRLCCRCRFPNEQVRDCEQDGDAERGPYDGWRRLDRDAERAVERVRPEIERGSKRRGDVHRIEFVTAVRRREALRDVDRE